MKLIIGYYLKSNIINKNLLLQNNSLVKTYFTIRAVASGETKEAQVCAIKMC